MGGTLISSGLEKCLEIVKERYHPSMWNVYAFHCSDGDNWPSDNDVVREAIESCLPKMQFYGYCEIEPSTERLQWMRESNLSNLFGSISGDKLKTSSIQRKEDIWEALVLPSVNENKALLASSLLIII